MQTFTLYEDPKASFLMHFELRLMNGKVLEYSADQLVKILLWNEWAENHWRAYMDLDKETRKDCIFIFKGMEIQITKEKLRNFLKKEIERKQIEPWLQDKELVQYMRALCNAGRRDDALRNLHTLKECNWSVAKIAIEEMTRD